MSHSTGTAISFIPADRLLAGLPSAASLAAESMQRRFPLRVFMTLRNPQMCYLCSEYLCLFDVVLKDITRSQILSIASFT